MDKLAEDPTQINLSPYAYVKGNPIRYNDPDGNCPSCIIALAFEAAGVEEGGTLGAATPAAAATVLVGLIAAAGDYIILSHNSTISSSPSPIDQSKSSEQEKSVPNPNGAKGSIDHQQKVKDLAEKARVENPGQEVLQEKKIRTDGSTRRPDVHVVDPQTGKTTKVYEAERNPNGARNKKREAEYDRLKIPHETHKVGN